MKETQIPLHERLVVGIFLAAAAGGLDAYTYLFHGKVFAGLQTGNFILLGLNLGAGNWSLAPHYLLPITAFLVGTLFTRTLQHLLKEDQTPLGKRQKLVLTIEIALMVLVAISSPWLPDMVATSLLSLTAAAQLQEFRRLRNGPFTSLMMTGNLRTLGETICDAVFHHDQHAGAKFWETLAVMVSFVIGATTTSLLGQLLGDRTILLSAGILLVPLGLLLRQPQQKL